MENIDNLLNMVVSGNKFLIEAFCKTNHEMNHENLTFVVDPPNSEGIVRASVNNPNRKVPITSHRGYTMNYSLTNSWETALAMCVLFNKVTPKIKINDWVKVDGKYYHKIESIIDGSIGPEMYPYVSANYEHLQYPEGYLREEDCVLATKDEIRAHLLIEAEKRGFVVGASYKNTRGEGEFIENPVVNYHQTLNLCSGSNTGLIYDDAKNLWGEVIGYPVITINDYSGEFFRAYVKFGCAKIRKEVFLTLNELIASCVDETKGHINNRLITTVQIGSGTFNSAQIQKIAQYYIEKEKATE